MVSSSDYLIWDVMSTLCYTKTHTLNRCCNNALHCPVGKALWPASGRRRRPIRPQAGSYVGLTRRLVGARLRATRRLNDKDRPW